MIRIFALISTLSSSYAGDLYNTVMYAFMQMQPRCPMLKLTISSCLLGGQAKDPYVRPSLFSTLSIETLHLQFLLKQALHASLNRIHILCRSNVILASGLPTRERQILGHDSIDVDGVDASLLEALSESDDLRRAVQLSALHKTARPGEDRGDGVCGRLVALLVLAVMTSDGAVCGFRLKGLAIGCDEDGSHES
jgi:hypothetical protein